MKKNKFEIGDTVRRYRNGGFGHIKQGDEFVISAIDSYGNYADHFGYTHDSSNLELVKKKEEIINNYSIF